MLIICSEKKFNIDDKYIHSSPYLSTIRDTHLNIERVDDYVLIDVDIYCLEQYILYLQGSDFEFNEEIDTFFDYMGHVNTMGYPLDFWKIKLKDNWIRDNFYRLELWKDPYYGLKEIPLVNEIKNLDISDGSSLFIAGGAALFMAGVTSKYDDIDIFTTSKEDSLSWARENSITDITICKDVVIIPIRSISKRIQLILRLYKSPAEIIYGFDLDCVGILYDGHRLYATERAIYSMNTHTNWFDPERASPSYVHRLCKYMKRGYDIRLPFEDQITLDTKKIDEYWNNIHRYIEENRGKYYYKGIQRYNIVSKSFPNLSIPSPLSLSVLYTDFIRHSNLIEQYETIHQKQLKYDGKTLFILDKVSILMLCKYYGYYPFYGVKSDYNQEQRDKIEWKIANPMEQLSGTFNPTPLHGEIELLEWYKKSPYIHIANQ